MIFPSREDVIALNRRLTQASGDDYVPPDNLREPGSLEWVLDAIQYPLFGVEPYPTLSEKAALLTWTIIDGHVFFDGNKRTGMAALIIFLRLNGCDLGADTEDIIRVALRVAQEHGDPPYSRGDFEQWIRQNIVVRPGWVASASVSI